MELFIVFGNSDLQMFLSLLFPLVYSRRNSLISEVILEANDPVSYPENSRF